MSSDHDLERKADSPNRKLMVPQFVRIGASLLNLTTTSKIEPKGPNSAKKAPKWVKLKQRDRL